MDSDSEIVILSAAAAAVVLYLATYYFFASGTNGLRRWWVRPVIRAKKEGEYYTLFAHMRDHDHEAFFEYCRLEKWQFDKLLEMVNPYLLKTSIRRPVPIEMRLAMTLRHLAHRGKIKILAWNFRVGKSTAAKIVQETSDILWRVLSEKYVRVPEGDEWLDIVRQFWNAWNFPNCAGAIDGKHVSLQAPLKCGSEWYCYKGFHSCALLAACDAEYQFIWVDMGGYGSRSDGGLLADTHFGQAVLEGVLDLPHIPLPGTQEAVAVWYVADAAFPLKLNIMRPYPGHHLDEDKDVFNYRLSRARRVIENAFGILVARWQILQTRISGLPSTASKYVLAAVALHNFVMKAAKGESNRYNPNHFVDEEVDGALVLGDWHQHVGPVPHTDLGRVGANNPTRNAIQLRDSLKRYLYQVAPVEWQWRAVNRGRTILM